MAHALITILKIIGIILLCLIGIVIFLIVAILFAPFRYKIDAKKSEDQSFKECSVRGNVTWMWIFLRCRYSLVSGESKLSIRFLGIDVMKLNELIKKRNKGYDLNNKKSSKTKSKKKKKKNDNTKDLHISQNKADTFNEERILPIDNSLDDTVFNEKGNEEKKGKLEGIKEKVSGLKDKVINIKNKVKDTIQRVLYYKEELSKDENKLALKFLWGKVKQVLDHIKPRKLKGNITFGMEEPDKTGQALGVLAVFYPIYGNNLTVKPDFTTKCLYGDIVAKGRIRIFTLLVICIKLIRSNEYKRINNIIKK